MDLGIFFDPVPLPDDGPMDPAGIAAARAICEGCPVRLDCFVDTMAQEGNATELRRHGVFAGLTGAQRAAVFRRDTMRCYECSDLFDPLALRTGDLWCSCGPTDSPPIADAGDQWLPRHTVLSNRITKWILIHTEVGGRVPAPSVMVGILASRKDDTHQIYRALVDAGLLEAGGRGVYTRKAGIRAWVPDPLKRRLTHSAPSALTQ